MTEERVGGLNIKLQPNKITFKWALKAHLIAELEPE
jgi:hypothetical protein